jgi:DNA repair exonuclease SbcCD ATPase subunit
MITFHKARAKNFLAIGNYWIEYDLDKDHMTVLRGKNGASKSTITDILTFALYKKAYRQINIPQLVNSVNKKDCVVEIEFSIGTNQWKVRRGISPNIFEIYKNDTLLDQHSSVIEQQKWFEQNVLKINYKTFCSIVIMGSGNYVPFMRLTAAERREVVEELLDIKVFSSMNAIVKERIKGLKDEIKLLSVKKSSVEDKIQMQQNFINQIEKNSQDIIQEKQLKIEALTEKQKETQEENNQLSQAASFITDQLQEYSGATDNLKKLGSEKGKILQKMTTIKENYQFFVSTDVCPTCSQTIDEDLKQQKQKQSKSDAKELKEIFINLQQSIEKEEERENTFLRLSKELNTTNSKISQNNLKIAQINSQIKELNTEIETIVSQVKNTNEEHNKLEGFHKDLQDITETILRAKEDIHYYDFTHGLLKDSGVKTSIIKKYVPLLTQQINKYLQMMDLYVNFNLDEEFNETITTPVYESFSYGNFSAGQAQRIDLAIAFALMKIAEFKNSAHVNINFYDEILDNSLDFAGVSDFFKIIRTELTHKNVFIISHREGIEDKFDKIILFEKKGHFSYKTEIFNK